MRFNSERESSKFNEEDRGNYYLTESYLRLSCEYS
jgi:hypothetical protein